MKNSYKLQPTPSELFKVLWSDIHNMKPNSPFPDNLPLASVSKQTQVENLSVKISFIHM